MKLSVTTFAVAVLCFGCGQVDESLSPEPHTNTAQELPDPKQNGLVHIQEEAVATEKQERATEVWNTPARLTLFMVEKNRNQKAKGALLNDIATSLTKAKSDRQFVEPCLQAVELARKIEDPETRFSILSNISLALVKSGAATQAVESAQPFESAFAKVGILSLLIPAYMERGDKENASLTAKQTIEIAQNIKNGMEKSVALSRVAAAQFKIRDRESALATLKKSVDIAKNIEGKRNKRRALQHIVLVPAEAGEGNLAVEISQELESTLEQNVAFSEVALALAELGKEEKAVEIAQKIQDAETKNETMDEISLIQAKEKNQPSKIIQKTEDILRNSVALTDIAFDQVEMGEEEEAMVTLKQAIEALPKIEITFVKSIAQINIARTFAKIGDVEQALEFAMSIEESFAKSDALSTIAAVTADSGQVEEAINIAKKIDNPEQVVFALSRISIVLATESLSGQSGIRRMKIDFTPKELQLAELLVELVETVQHD